VPSNKKLIKPTFSVKETNNYIRQKDKAHFNSPEEEYDDAFLKYKECSKCKIMRRLTDFNGNTSGCDAFDRKGYRLRRPECYECTNLASKGKLIAKNVAKKEGVSYTAPEGSRCNICNKIQDENNKLVFDHCHKTNKFRGYCCNSCNRSLGVLGDDVNGLINVINYLLINNPVVIKQNEAGKLYIDM
jgi:hypothetical protein